MPAAAICRAAGVPLHTDASQAVGKIPVAFRELGVDLLTVAAGDNTLRVVPPLVIDDSHIDEFMDKLSAGAASFQPPEAA